MKIVKEKRMKTNKQTNNNHGSYSLNLIKKRVECRFTKNREYILCFSLLLFPSAVAVVLFIFAELFSTPTHPISLKICKARKGGFVQAVLAPQKVNVRMELRGMGGSP